MTTSTSLSDTLAAAVATARTGALRIEAGHGVRQTATISSADLAVTSQRALRGHESVAVYDDAGTRFDAMVLGVDEALDLAVLRANGAAWTPLELADPSALRTGQLTFALGRPGVQIRASLRVLGLLGDEVRTPAGGTLDRYIESDRGLPDGFEGGPLIDERGALIGMNSSSVLRGADLAVPHTTLARSIAELVAHGRIRRGYLGVACQPVRLPASLRATLGQRSGALVLDTEDGGPANAAGITLGDVIVKVDDTPVRGPRELQASLRDKLGVTIHLGILRNGQPQTIELIAKERS